LLASRVADEHSRWSTKAAVNLVTDVGATWYLAGQRNTQQLAGRQVPGLAGAGLQGVTVVTWTADGSYFPVAPGAQTVSRSSLVAT
jgi:hypothetical protein